MEAEEYFSKDFEWEELERQILNDPSLQYHLLPFEPSSSSAISPPEEESNAWRKFHSRHHTGKFFKERRYLLKEFPELVSCGQNSRVLEVGCGNGSTALPILRGNENVTLYACDCSSEALEYAKEMVDAAKLASARHRFHPFFCDFSLTGFPEWLFCGPCRRTSLSRFSPSDVKNTVGTLTGDLHSSKESSCCLGGLDFVTLIFTLSAIPFQKMPLSLTECFSVLKPGGFALFRDYGLFDMTMLRFELEKRVGFREYMRSDGTRSYFFSLETVRDLFLQSGFIEVELDYCCIKSLNRKKGKSMSRVWVHGKFQKPPL